MSFWDLDESGIIPLRHGARGKPERRAFGIVRHESGHRVPKLIIPHMSGAQPGQKVRYKLVEGGIAFRIGNEGEYTVVRASRAARCLNAVMPDELAKYASAKVKDIIAHPYHGGWFVPFEQFK